MSLVRQIWLLLIATLLLALAGSIAVNVHTARAQFEDQLRVKNNDNAAALALAMSQQKGNLELISLLASAQFDTGFYQSVKLTGLDGGALLAREAPPQPMDAPSWFVSLLPIESRPGIAKVSDGWRALGEVRVVSHTAYAYEALWKSSVEAALAMGAIGLLAVLMAALVVDRVHRVLRGVVEQARALVDGRFLTMPEPAMPDFRHLTQAMNHMVSRLSTIFQAQAQQVEELRRIANCDALTGLSERRYFLAQLDSALQAEDGPAHAGLVLLRLLDLTDLNQRLGRTKGDQILTMVAQSIEQYAKRVPSCITGRLNGSDFALYMPVPGMAQECATALSAALRMVLLGLEPSASVVIGAVAVSRSHSLSQVMSLADIALARAESRGSYSVEVLGQDSAEASSPLTEAQRKLRLEYALSGNKLRLAEFPVLNAEGRIVHLECPARIQIEESGPYLPAAYWLSWALRAKLATRVDERVVALALQDIGSDGLARCVHLCGASFHDDGLLSRLHDRVQAAGENARLLWLEVPESRAIDQPLAIKELAAAMRPLGVRVGVEHSGGQVSRMGSLLEYGLDFVKLDGATTRGISSDAQKLQFVQSTVALLKGMNAFVIAEGVLDDADVQALWQTGVDAVTGPWATQQRPRWGHLEE